MDKKFSDAKENFLQRRYGVSLGRRYALAAASVVLFSVLGCSQVDSKKKALLNLVYLSQKLHAKK
ncbi:hypothetical protein FM036_36350, partial [Nostoc sp. HG1]|nr:hypothetical protein [Nostoc sp. HG1]